LDIEEIAAMVTEAAKGIAVHQEHAGIAEEFTTRPDYLVPDEVQVVWRPLAEKPISSVVAALSILPAGSVLWGAAAAIGQGLWKLAVMSSARWPSWPGDLVPLPKPIPLPPPPTKPQFG
jgi:hypothetical protein